MQPIPETMKAAAIDRFGGPEVLHTESLPVPEPGPHEVLIEVAAAGVGVWDPYVRSGELDLGDGKKKFPKVIGNDGAGTVVAVGEGVTRFKEGDPVYTYAFEGGLYAEYAAVKEDEVAPLPKGLDLDEAGALGADGVTALIGLEDKLKLKKGQTVLIFGANGGIGHIAVQLAKRMGARVIAIASHDDGVALAKRLGADEVLEGHREDLGDMLRKLAPKGIDAALVVAGNAGRALVAMKKGGRVAYPNGVEPAPTAKAGVSVIGYDGSPSPDAFERLNRWNEAGAFHVELGRTYPLDEAARAHQELASHHLGKSALRVKH